MKHAVQPDRGVALGGETRTGRGMNGGRIPTPDFWDQLSYRVAARVGGGIDGFGTHELRHRRTAVGKPQPASISAPPAINAA